MYSLLLEAYTELEQKKEEHQIHLNIYQEKQSSPKDNFNLREKSTTCINQHFSDDSIQNSYIKSNVDIHVPRNYRVHHTVQ